MPAIKLDKFGGMLPAWDDTLLPDGQAGLSVNGYLFSGALVGWRQPKLLHTLNSSTTKFAYRVPNKTSNDLTITASDSFWMEFDDADTKVIRTPVVGDTFDRYYFASPSQPPKYNPYDRIIAGNNPWLLGVPASDCAPGVVVTGGGDTVSIGFNSITNGSGTNFVGGNSIFLIPIIPQGNLLLQDVAFMPEDTLPSANFTGVIYSDLNGAPFQLLGSSNNVFGCTAGTQVTCAFVNAVAVTPNVQYWIGIATDTNVDIAIANTGTKGAKFLSTYSNGPPAFAPGAVGSQPNWQMWGDFTGSSVFVGRSYVYTWVTAYGEEGPPSPPTLVDGWSNATWTVSLFTPVAANMGVDRNITKTRIYRTVSSVTGFTTYFLVAEIPVTQATYTDTSDDITVSNNIQLASSFWFPPPSDLQGIVSFPNGITVGWRSNELWFSEAYRPHAWPPNYVLTTEFPIVGVGVAGSSIIICTEGQPYLATGVNPSSMALQKINLPEPCIHKGSIVSTDTTVLYVSKNGLIQIDQSGNGANVTELWCTRERWEALTPQKFVRAIKHASTYFAFGSVSGADNSTAQQGFTVELSTADQVSFTIWPQAGGHRLGFNQLTSPNGFDIFNVLVDPWTGIGMLLQNHAIYYYDFTDQSPVIVPYKWRSKVYHQTSKRNYEAMRVFFNIPAGSPTPGVRNTNAVQTLGANQYMILRVYVNSDAPGAPMTLWTTREVQTSGELLRVLSGIKKEMWQFEIEGRVNVQNLQVATSVKELGLI